MCNVYQYDSDLGDTFAGIAPGTIPIEFQNSWRCPVCGADKKKQIEIPEEDFR